MRFICYMRIYFDNYFIILSSCRLVISMLVVYTWRAPSLAIASHIASFSRYNDMLPPKKKIKQEKEEEHRCRKKLKQSAMYKIYEMKSKWKMASGKMELDSGSQKCALFTVSAHLLQRERDWVCETIEEYKYADCCKHRKREHKHNTEWKMNCCGDIIYGHLLKYWK